MIGLWAALPLVATAALAEPIAPARNPARTDIAVKLGEPPSMPDDYKINLLIRTTIVAVNQANKTGNYSVLHELGPAFRMQIHRSNWRKGSKSSANPSSICRPFCSSIRSSSRSLTSTGSESSG